MNVKRYVLRAVTGAFLLLALHSSLAIGWETVTPKNIESTGIELTINYDTYRGCHNVAVRVPEIFHFKEIGKRPFQGINLAKVENKHKGWQLTGKGTRIAFETKNMSGHHEVSLLCLSAQELSHSHLEIWHKTTRGQPPIVIIIEPGDFSR